ncbi:MAG: hypothetical protein DRJ15_17895 [Bacteroidetes bacterium]|nr:MAG: hypothetical protein DRJ15_17895 [Bacteroidota bacterium]
MVKKYLVVEFNELKEEERPYYNASAWFVFSGKSFLCKPKIEFNNIGVRNFGQSLKFVGVTKEEFESKPNLSMGDVGKMVETKLNFMVNDDFKGFIKALNSILLLACFVLVEPVYFGGGYIEDIDLKGGKNSRQSPFESRKSLIDFVKCVRLVSEADLKCHLVHGTLKI